MHVYVQQRQNTNKSYAPANFNGFFERVDVVTSFGVGGHFYST